VLEWPSCWATSALALYNTATPNASSAAVTITSARASTPMRHRRRPPGTATLRVARGLLATAVLEPEDLALT